MGQTQTLSAKVTNPKKGAAPVEWSSSDETVAKVSSKGEVTAIAEGETTITGKSGKKKVKVSIVVKAKESDNATGNTPGNGGNQTPGNTPGNSGNQEPGNTPGNTPGNGGNQEPGNTPGTGENQEPGTKPDDTPSAEGGKVYFLNYDVETDEAWQAIAAEYTAATGTEVKVLTAATGGYEWALLSEMDRENAPTLFRINGLSGYQFWKDYTLDLSNTDLYANLSNKSLAVTGDDGGVYGIPYHIEGYGIIYNDAIMQKYFATEGAKASSVDEIVNYAKLKEVVEDMTAKKEELGIEGVFASTSLLPYEDWRWHTHLANLPMYYEFKDKNIIDTDVFEFTYAENYKNIFDLYINNSCTDPSLLTRRDVYCSMAEFALGDVAMVQNGSWSWEQISYIDGNVVKAEDCKFMPIYTGVSGEENQGICIGSERYWSINSKASAADIQATKNFVNWLISSEKGKAYMVNDLKYVAPFITLADNEMNPLSKSMLAFAESGKTNVNWAFLSIPSQDFKDDFGSALGAYCEGDMAWEDVVNTVVTRWAEEKQKYK